MKSVQNYYFVFEVVRVKTEKGYDMSPQLIHAGYGILAAVNTLLPRLNISAMSIKRRLMGKSDPDSRLVKLKYSRSVTPQGVIVVFYKDI